ncbi:MAG: hypothetical protein ACJ8GW_15410 [Massilia sp.]
MIHATPLQAAASLLVAALLLGGCASPLPYYESTPTDATVTVIGMGRPAMCTGGAGYRFNLQWKDQSTSIKVPVGQRVQLSSYIYIQGYNVTSSCNPTLSFIAAPGKSYILNAGLANGQCFSELVQEKADSPTGVAPEPTLAGLGCN